VAQQPEIAFGKTQLVTNGARLVQRAKRLHLLGPPFAAMLLRRIARQLGLRQTGDLAVLEAGIEQRLARRFGQPVDIGAMAQALRAARGPHELLRAAGALKNVERMLKR
jgi:hypothetical protein